MNAVTKAAEAIEMMVDKKVKKASEGGPKSVTAVVSNIDSQGKIWVVIPGSESATPVKRSSADVSVGDTVTVTVGNNRASIDSNISNPSAGMIRVVETQETANKAMDRAGVASAAAQDAITSAESASEQAASAVESANNARTSADDAQASAVRANESAENALVSANAANEKAIEASGSASDALQSAQDANGFAKSALEGLSLVEDVVDVVEWLAAHATPTSDAEIYPEKAYYTRSDQGVMNRVDESAVAAAYSESADEEVDQSKTYYVHTADHYELTQDTVIDPSKTYYAESSGEYVEITENIYAYVPTQDATVSESKNYYSRVELYGYVLTQDTWPVQGKTYYEEVEGSYAPITDHAYVYALTEDSAIDQTKTYYTRTETSGYAYTSDTMVDQSKTYYIQGEDVETYALTEDEHVVEGKVYYVPDGEGGYSIVEEPTDEDIATYYELHTTATYVVVEEPNDADLPSYYELVTSVSYDEVEQPDVADIATYYELTMDMSGYYERAITGYDYQDVEEPTDADIATYYERTVDMSAYYEHIPESYSQAEPQGSENPSALGWMEQGNPKLQGLYELNDSVNNYIATHLGLTDEGLNLVNDDSSYRMLVASDGVYIYDNLSRLVGKYGTDMQIGALSGTHMVASEDVLMFLPGGKSGRDEVTGDIDVSQAVAYIAVIEDPHTHVRESVFYMTKSVVVKDMFFGDGMWKWYKRPNNNMSLKWMGAM